MSGDRLTQAEADRTIAALVKVLKSVACGKAELTRLPSTGGAYEWFWYDPVNCPHKGTGTLQDAVNGLAQCIAESP